MAEKRGALRWIKQEVGGDAYFAFSGEIIVGLVGRRDDGMFVYDAANAVHMRFSAKGQGEVANLRAAKKAVERAWERWLERAGLRQDEETTRG